MKTTVVIQIGNSDDRLTQIMWAMFIERVEQLAYKYSSGQIHFSGFSNPMAVWQNACWVLTIDSSEALLLWDDLRQLRLEFKQDSIAWTEGITVFIDE